MAPGLPSGLVPLLDAVVREALRLYPAFGDGLVREATDDTQLLGRYTVSWCARTHARRLAVPHDGRTVVVLSGSC